MNSIDPHTPDGSALARWRQSLEPLLVPGPDDPPIDVLTVIEQVLVLGLCAGMTRADLASMANYSQSSIDRLIGNIYVATGFSRQHQIVAWMWRHWHAEALGTKGR